MKSRLRTPGKSGLRRLAVLALCLLATTAIQAANRGGLRTNYAKIVVDNLPIGHSISLTKLASLPLVVGNNFDAPISVTITSRTPTAPREGYEAIPDSSWVEPEVTTVELAAGAETNLDIVLHIPNDHYLFGRKFQADIVIHSSRDGEGGGVVFSYELAGNLLFSIAPTANDEALAQAMATPLNAAYSLSPPRVDIFEVEPGDRVQVIGDSGGPVQLRNDSKDAQTFVLQSIDPGTTQFTPDPGSQYLGTADDVAIPVDTLNLAPHETKALNLSVIVPQNANLHKGPLLYLVAVKNGQTQTVEQYVKIYLWAGQRPPKPDLGRF
ncbi:MAG TPA: hypothetical protein VIH35_01245 [Kiritimatiellia bacterium]